MLLMLRSPSSVTSLLPLFPLVLQTIELATQKRIAQIGLISGIIYSVGHAPAAATAAVRLIAQLTDEAQRSLTAWAAGHSLGMQGPLVLAACLCLAGSMAFRTGVENVGNGCRARME